MAIRFTSGLRKAADGRRDDKNNKKNIGFQHIKVSVCKAIKILSKHAERIIMENNPLNLFSIGLFK